MEAKTDDTGNNIVISGARVHNLQNISLSIPRDKLVVITGLSGSGKSSLAFDTLYAEGQRRYVESLSAYARQFLGRMPKPEVDYIHGIAPAIAIEQKVKTYNPRSTVGTSTEIYDFLKLLYARIGRTFSPVSGNLVTKDTVGSVVDFIMSQKVESVIFLSCPLNLHNGRKPEDQLQVLLQQGYNRLIINGETVKITEVSEKGIKKNQLSKTELLIDRMILSGKDDQMAARAGDSAQTAFYEGRGSCIVRVYSDEKQTDLKEFSDKYECDGISFEEPGVNLFSFNNPYGACRRCEGFGSIIGIDEDLVIPNKSLSIYEDAVVCWKGEKMSEWKEKLVMSAYKFGFPVHKPYFELSQEQKELLWEGNKHFGGLHDFFRFVEEQSYKIQYRVMLSRYRGKTICPECKGTRLRKDASYVKVAGKSIVDLLLMPVEELSAFFSGISLSDYERKLTKHLLPEIQNRLKYLSDVGLGYLTLNRSSNTLSGGESQRINLATALGSSLTGSMYILDEPSVGLHPRDTARLISVLRRLRDAGNSVIVVEHDEDIIRAADHVIDIGPGAGNLGGKIIFEGSPEQLIQDSSNLTGRYLSGEKSITDTKTLKGGRYSIKIKGARENNLKNIDVGFPLNTLCVVSGVSGSGKTSLVKRILYAALKKQLGGMAEKTGKFDRLEGDLNRIDNVELVDQNPIGRSSRSNPVTYVKAYDEIRTLFSDQPMSKMRGYKPGFFSFNIEGGRCEECQGDGHVKIEMQFMADIYLKCESCGGKRFKEDVLDVLWRGKNITDVLDMTVEEAIFFFGAGQSKNAAENRICDKLQPLSDVGLGYVKLGQPSSTLSGGEAQRLKLAFFLSRGQVNRPSLFIFDEPTTGLHYHDISKLFAALQALIDNGHSVIVIEHNKEIIRHAGWVIDLGPEGGDRGGNIVFEGKPEDLLKSSDSYTGKLLKKFM
jgi:excinuclease ABC subunit A